MGAKTLYLACVHADCGRSETHPGNSARLRRKAAMAGWHHGRCPVHNHAAHARPPRRVHPFVVPLIVFALIVFALTHHSGY